MIEITNIFVTRGFSRWHVKEEGFDTPIATFMEEEDALSYATSLAKTKASANVRILDERGDIIAEQSFAMAAGK